MFNRKNTRETYDQNVKHFKERLKKTQNIFKANYCHPQNSKAFLFITRFNKLKKIKTAKT